MYLTHEDYLNMGGRIASVTAYRILESQARKKLDLYTQGRIAALDAVPDDIKLLMLLLVEQLETAQERPAGAVASVSNDGYSVSYESAEAAQDTAERAMLALIHEYAAPWCFRGLDRRGGK